MRVRPAFYERSHCNLPQLLSGISFVYTETDEEVLHYSQLMFVRRRYPITGFPLTYVRLTRLGNDLGFVLVISIFPSPPLSLSHVSIPLSLVSIPLFLLLLWLVSAPSIAFSIRAEGEEEREGLCKRGKAAVRI